MQIYFYLLLITLNVPLRIGKCTPGWEPWSGSWALSQVTWAKMDKNLSLMMSLTKNRNPKLNFFHCRLEDLPSLLSVWTAL